MGSPRTGAAARSPPREPSPPAALSAQRVQPRCPGRCCPRCGAECGTERGAAAAPGPAQPNPPPPVSPAAAFRPLPLAPGVPSPLPPRSGAEQRGAERPGKCCGAARSGGQRGRGAAPSPEPAPRSPALGPGALGGAGCSPSVRGHEPEPFPGYRRKFANVSLRRSSFSGSFFFFYCWSESGKLSKKKVSVDVSELLLY